MICTVHTESMMNILQGLQDQTHWHFKEWTLSPHWLTGWYLKISTHWLTDVYVPTSRTLKLEAFTHWQGILNFKPDLTNLMTDTSRLQPENHWLISQGFWNFKLVLTATSRNLKLACTHWYFKSSRSSRLQAQTHRHFWLMIIGAVN